MATPQRIKLPLPHSLQTVEDVLLWRNPVTSAAALGGITILYLLVEWSTVPLLAWISNVVLVAIIGTLIWAQAAKFLSRPSPSDVFPPVLRTGVDEATGRAVAENVRSALNRLLAALSRVLSGNDIATSLKAAALVWVVGWCGRLLSPVGLLYTAVLAAFILPKVRLLPWVRPGGGGA